GTGTGRRPPRHPGLPQQPRLRLRVGWGSGPGHPLVGADPDRLPTSTGGGSSAHQDGTGKPGGCPKTERTKKSAVTLLFQKMVARVAVATAPSAPGCVGQSDKPWAYAHGPRCALGERFVLAQVGQDEKGLLTGVEQPPGRPDRLASPTDQPGDVVQR